MTKLVHKKREREITKIIITDFRFDMLSEVCNLIYRHIETQEETYDYPGDACNRDERKHPLQILDAAGPEASAKLWCFDIIHYMPKRYSLRNRLVLLVERQVMLTRAP